MQNRYMLEHLKFKYVYLLCIVNTNDNNSTAGMILQRRKDTASFLRQAAEKVNTMEETQVTELKQQIKVIPKFSNRSSNP